MIPLSVFCNDDVELTIISHRLIRVCLPLYAQVFVELRINNLRTYAYPSKLTRPQLIAGCVNCVVRNWTRIELVTIYRTMTANIHLHMSNGLQVAS